MIALVLHALLAVLSIGAFARRPPLEPSILTMIPLVVGAGWVAAPYVSSFKSMPAIRRRWARWGYLGAVAAAFAPGFWTYARLPDQGGDRVLVFMLVPLVQAIALTIAGAVAKAGERPYGRGRDESRTERAQR